MQVQSVWCVLCCGRVCAWLCMEDVLNFMLYSSCDYGGIHIGIESGMNLMEVGKK